MFQEQNKDNVHFVNGTDYSDILEIVSFALLKNRDDIFKQITNESDEETIKWINIYIEEDEEQTETVQKIKDIIKGSTGESATDKMLDIRERVLSGKSVQSSDDRRNKMLNELQDSNEDEIQFIGGK
jgi:hypothetical protein